MIKRIRITYWRDTYSVRYCIVVARPDGGYKVYFRRRKPTHMAQCA